MAYLQGTSYCSPRSWRYALSRFRSRCPPKSPHSPLDPPCRLRLCIDPENTKYCLRRAPAGMHRNASAQLGPLVGLTTASSLTQAKLTRTITANVVVWRVNSINRTLALTSPTVSYEPRLWAARKWQPAASCVIPSHDYMDCRHVPSKQSGAPAPAQQRDAGPQTSPRAAHGVQMPPMHAPEQHWTSRAQDLPAC
jgi:hypothetical protein